jgi:hypothetical protein
MTSAVAGAALGGAARVLRPPPETAPRGVVSGVSVAIGAAGMILIVAGVHRSPIADVLRAAIRGEPIPQGLWDGDPHLSAKSGTTPAAPSAFTIPGDQGTAMGRAVAADATQYVGKVPYVFGRQTPTTGWDCSGFVTWVLHHDLGLELPNNTHTYSGQFYVWSGARTIPREQCAPGDLCCWVGHVGIALDNQRMINAANPRQGTLVSNIWKMPAPVIRRPLAYGAAIPTVST